VRPDGLALRLREDGGRRRTVNVATAPVSEPASLLTATVVTPASEVWTCRTSVEFVRRRRY